MLTYYRMTSHTIIINRTCDQILSFNWTIPVCESWDIIVFSCSFCPILSALTVQNIQWMTRNLSRTATMLPECAPALIRSFTKGSGATGRLRFIGRQSQLQVVSVSSNHACEGILMRKQFTFIHVFPHCTDASTTTVVSDLAKRVFIPLSVPCLLVLLVLLLCRAPFKM